MFNSYHPKILYSVENPNHSHINFLDITITFNGYFFLPLIGTENLHSNGKFLNFLSCTPQKHKISVINSLTDRNTIVQQKTP